MALEADGIRLATGSSDGVVRVWDTSSGDLVHEVPLGPRAIEGVGFVGDAGLVVALADGDLEIVTTDPAELLDLARASLTRGFSLPECARYNFGDDCPTLADLGAVAIDRDDPLAGTYRIVWDRDQFAATLLTGAEADLGGTPPDELVAGISDLASEYAGTYTLTFADGRFDVALDSMPETFCTGTYAIRGDRVRLRAERGRCGDDLFFDASFDVSGGVLTFGRDDFRGGFPLEFLFASRRLERVRVVTPR